LSHGALKKPPIKNNILLSLRKIFAQDYIQNSPPRTDSLCPMLADLEKEEVSHGAVSTVPHRKDIFRVSNISPRKILHKVISPT
jgi:hypothetical protein